MTKNWLNEPRFVGSGMTSQRARDRLAERLREQGIQSDAVLETIRNTPRHIFIDEALSSHAYDNNPLPIGFGQTISQPYIVARMTETLLSRGALDKVLEIGTGCGYQTAVLAQLVNRVYTVERIQSLSRQAQQRLTELGLNNVSYRHGDGYEGWRPYGPYQGIIVTAAPEEVPPALLQQLTVGGHMIIPVGAFHGYQVLKQVIRTSKGYESHTLNHVGFVPLLSGVED